MHHGLSPQSKARKEIKARATQHGLERQRERERDCCFGYRHVNLPPFVTKKKTQLTIQRPAHHAQTFDAMHTTAYLVGERNKLHTPPHKTSEKHYQGCNGPAAHNPQPAKQHRSCGYFTVVLACLRSGAYDVVSIFPPIVHALAHPTACSAIRSPTIMCPSATSRSHCTWYVRY